MKYIMNQLDTISLFYSISPYSAINAGLLTVFVVLKLFLFFVINAYWRRDKTKTPLLLLMIPIISYLIGEMAIILSLFSNSLIVKTLWRIAWNMQPIQFYAQILLIYSLVHQRYILQQKDKFVLCGLFIFTTFPIFAVFTTPSNNNSIMLLFFDILCWTGIVKRTFMKICGYCFLILTLVAMCRKTFASPKTPYILKIQLKKFFILMCVPLLFDSISILGNIFSFQSFFSFNVFRLLDLLSVASFTASLLFFARRIYHLRFLNLTEQVIAGPTSRLTSEQLLETKHTLCTARALFELSDVHARFFDQLAHISPERIIFYVRKPVADNHTVDTVGQTIEQFLQNQPALASHYFVEDSLLVYDELAFTNFYEQSDDITAILLFMEQLHATVFIPLKQDTRLFGAIIIIKEDQKDELFSQAIQTQMQLYGTFVTYALDRFEQVNHRALIEEHKKISLELFKTNEKNARFHESLASLLKPDTLKRNGIVLYKNALFYPINTITQELLQVNPNLHHGHPLTKALKEVVRRVTQYGTPHTVIEKNISGQAICCQAFPYQHDELVILISLADVTDTLSLEHTLLNPADVDYTIFLHATESGQIINQTVPGAGIVMHTAKVHLLKILLSKKTMILDVHDDDVDMMLSIAQRVCRKTNVHSIDAAKTGGHDTFATLLCGKQRFTPTEIIAEHGILYTLDESGIIHIANAHRLEIATQKLLLQFFKTGSFCLYRSESRHTSNVTIILSSNDDLALLCRQGLFLKELHEYLKDAIITLPNLGTLPFAELDSLARSFQKQLIVAAEYYHLFGLSTQEQEKLDTNRPASYQELHKMISVWIKQRMNQSALASETTLYTPKAQTHDTMLLDAARLGKQTLKNRKLMRALWEKFKNQSKIAQLLDVDRSSVHRRLKEYGIGQETVIR